MTQEEKMLFFFDWTLDEDAFRARVEAMIQDAVKSDKVLPLPFECVTGQPFLDLLTSILAQVECSQCDAPCCRSNPNGAPLELLPGEWDRIAKFAGLFDEIDHRKHIHMPCYFLKQHGCTIYTVRPFVCAVYPFQPGAVTPDGTVMFAVASSCPEGRRIALKVYLASWQLRRQYRYLGHNEFLKAFEVK